MKSVLIAPRKYVQGRGALKEVGAYLRVLGNKPLVLWDSNVKEIVGPTVLASIQEAGLEAVDVEFQGEATQQERERVGRVAGESRADVSVGIGGGKALDVAKAVAVDERIRMVTCPTIASNDSPTSAASVWYDEEHNFIGFDCWPSNPDLVLVDTQVVAEGPVRAFAAGMGDALATWVEAAAAFKTRAPTIAGGLPTMAAMAIAELCYETLMEHGIDAKRAVEHDVITPAVEKIVEANVLLSGIGFESGGLATAHMIANLLSNVPECKLLMHGEKVAFGIITQLCLDDEIETDEKEAIVDFEIEIGLPVTFAELNLQGATRGQLARIGEICAAEGSLCHNHPFEVTSESVVDAMIAADALGRERKEMIGVFV